MAENKGKSRQLASWAELGTGFGGSQLVVPSPSTPKAPILDTSASPCRSLIGVPGHQRGSQPAAPASSLWHYALSPATAHTAHLPHNFLREWPSFPKGTCPLTRFYRTVQAHTSKPQSLSPNFHLPTDTTPLYPYFSSEPVQC